MVGLYTCGITRSNWGVYCSSSRSSVRERFQQEEVGCSIHPGYTEDTMNLEIVAAELEMTIEELFKRAHAMYGHMWALQNSEMALKTFRKNGTIPIWINQYLKHRKRIPFSG